MDVRVQMKGFEPPPGTCGGDAVKDLSHLQTGYDDDGKIIFLPQRILSRRAERADSRWMDVTDAVCPCCNRPLEGDALNHPEDSVH